MTWSSISTRWARPRPQAAPNGRVPPRPEPGSRPASRGAHAPGVLQGSRVQAARPERARFRIEGPQGPLDRGFHLHALLEPVPDANGTGQTPGDAPARRP